MKISKQDSEEKSFVYFVPSYEAKYLTSKPLILTYKHKHWTWNKMLMLIWHFHLFPVALWKWIWLHNASIFSYWKTGHREVISLLQNHVVRQWQNNNIQMLLPWAQDPIKKTVFKQIQFFGRNDDQILMEFESLQLLKETTAYVKVQSVIVNRNIKSILQITIYY